MRLLNVTLIQLAQFIIFMNMLTYINQTKHNKKYHLRQSGNVFVSIC